MIEEELIKIWQSSSNEECIKFEKSKLMLELKSSLELLHRWWKIGVRVEIVAAFIAIPAFALIAYWAPYLTTKIASVLIIIYVFYVIIRLVGIKKLKPTDLEENYLEYLKKTKRYLKAQRNLMLTYIYWGLLPLYPILFLFVIEFWKIPSKRFLIIIVFISYIVLHIYSYFLIKKRVKKEINPRIIMVDTLIQEII